MKTEQYLTVGVMSGTSLDGLDLALCRFEYSYKKWKFVILKNQTISYDYIWKERLSNAHNLSGIELTRLDYEFGEFIGRQIKKFIIDVKEKPELISSHGHTVFHQPEEGISLQIGNGQVIAESTRITTVTDFRTKDILMGGQGAPLVPIGDRLLFSEYNYCLNLGGFANISYKKGWSTIAFDICPANIILNYLCPPFDENGIKGASGKVHVPLLTELRDLEYYQRQPPKSLGKEWLVEEFIPVIERFDAPEEDILRTVYEHIALLISARIRLDNLVLLTGGGVYNSFLVELIKKRSGVKLIIPEPEIIEYKEAMIFAFLGVLRVKNWINCLASVTGARDDSCCGVIYQV